MMDGCGVLSGPSEEVGAGAVFLDAGHVLIFSMDVVVCLMVMYVVGMKRFLVKMVIRARMLMTGRDAAMRKVRSEVDWLLEMMDEVGRERWNEGVRVRKMIGVDEDMRGWSLLDLCEHNAIVTRAMARVVEGLATGEGVRDPIDPKRDVMPKGELGETARADFSAAGEEYLAAVTGLGKLRGVGQYKHPLFGMLDAHGWHVMCGIHLEVHRGQVREILEGLRG